MESLRLITIPISHYCEKARWALERAGLSYREERHLQLFHYWPAYRAGGGDSVPVLVTARQVLTDSTDILHWIDTQISDDLKLYPLETELRQQVDAWEDDLDEGLGVAGRLWMYTFLLEEVKLLVEYSKKHDVPWYEVKVLPLVFPLAKGHIRSMLAMTPTSRADSKQDIDRAFDHVGERLSDGRTYLMGDRFTAADVTFAALAAAVLVPERYGVALPPLSALPEAMRSQISIWREHPAGRYALKLYEQRPMAVDRASKYN